MITECGDQVLVVDSVTDLDANAAGRIAVTGSHGGLFSGQAAAAALVSGAIFNDAGGGIDNAGVAGLALLDGWRIPAATAGFDSARIGDGHDTWTHGLITFCNDVASGMGVRPGMPCRRAGELMTATSTGRDRAASPQPIDARQGAPPEARVLVVQAPIQVWALDSASLVTPHDAGSVLAIGSHGGLPGGDPRRALRCSAALAAFNDAGVGKDRAGIQRLATLDIQGIPAVTVSADSARIGDGLSTLRDGVISATNACADGLGARRGTPFRELVDGLLRGPHSSSPFMA